MIEKRVPRWLLKGSLVQFQVESSEENETALLALGEAISGKGDSVVCQRIEEMRFYESGNRQVVMPCLLPDFQAIDD